LDEGNTWENCEFTDLLTSIEATEIVSDPNIQNGVFLLYGSRNEFGVLVSIDFSVVHESDCKGHDSPDTIDSDFETWEPSDQFGNQCLLGRFTKYIRRKASSRCSIPNLTTKDIVVVKNCSCTEENYQCDYCYVLHSDTCVHDPSIVCQSYDPKQPPIPCITTYTETQGYRRVPGDTCDPVSGVNHMPIVKPCSTTPTVPSQPVIDPPIENTVDVQGGGHPVVLVVFFIIVLIGASITGAWWLSGRHEKFRALLLQVGIPVTFLPDPAQPEVSGYSSVSTTFDDLEEDAPEIDLDDSTANT